MKIVCKQKIKDIENDETKIKEKSSWRKIVFWRLQNHLEQHWLITTNDVAALFFAEMCLEKLLKGTIFSLQGQIAFFIHLKKDIWNCEKFQYKNYFFKLGIIISFWLYFYLFFVSLCISYLLLMCQRKYGEEMLQSMSISNVSHYWQDPIHLKDNIIITVYMLT